MNTTYPGSPADSHVFGMLLFDTFLFTLDIIDTALLLCKLISVACDILSLKVLVGLVFKVN